MMHYEGGTKSFLDIISDVFSEVGLPLGGCLLSIFIAVKWKTSNLSKEIMKGNPNYENSLLEKFINVMMVSVCPFLLGAIFLITILQKFFSVQIF